MAAQHNLDAGQPDFDDLDESDGGEGARRDGVEYRNKLG